MALPSREFLFTEAGIKRLRSSLQHKRRIIFPCRSQSLFELIPDNTVWCVQVDQESRQLNPVESFGLFDQPYDRHWNDSGVHVLDVRTDYALPFLFLRGPGRIQLRFGAKQRVSPSSGVQRSHELIVGLSK